MGTHDLVVYDNLELCSLGFALASCIQGQTCLCFLSDMILRASDLLLCWLYHIFQQKGTWFFITQQICSPFSAAGRVVT